MKLLQMNHQSKIWTKNCRLSRKLQRNKAQSQLQNLSKFFMKKIIFHKFNQKIQKLNSKNNLKKKNKKNKLNQSFWKKNLNPYQRLFNHAKRLRNLLWLRKNIRVKKNFLIKAKKCLSRLKWQQGENNLFKTVT